jgi:carbamoylphosphate synthase small subunit
MPAPHIGNTGVNDADAESRQIWVSGYVVREPARLASSWRAQRSLQAELTAQGVTGIAMAGTRALTRHLRDAGAMRAGISADTTDAEALLARVLDSPQMIGADLAREVSTPESYVVSPPAGTPVRYRGPRDQGGGPAVDGGARLRGARAACHLVRGRDRGLEPGRGVLLQRPWRPSRDQLRR